MGLTTNPIRFPGGRGARGFFFFKSSGHLLGSTRLHIHCLTRLLSQVKSGRNVRQTTVIYLGPKIKTCGVIPSTPTHLCDVHAVYVT